MSHQILLLFRSLKSSGGAEDQVVLHFEALANAGFDVLIMVDDPAVAWVVERFPATNLVKFSYRTLFKHRKRALISYLVHDHVSAAVASIFGCKWIPYEQTHPNYYADIARRSWRAWLKHKIQQRFYMLFADKLIVQTTSAQSAWAEILDGHVQQNKIRVLPNIFMPSAALKDYITQPSRTKRIVMVGRLIDIKDYELSLKVFFAMREVNAPEFTVDIYGVGPLASNLAVAVKKLDLADIVVFRQFERDKKSIYLDKDVFFMSSKAEGMPNALGEAMSFGLVCASLDFEAGPRDLLGPNSNDILPQLITGRDPRAVAEKLSEILKSNAGQLSDVGLKNHGRIEASFSRRDFASKVTAML